MPNWAFHWHSGIYACPLSRSMLHDQIRAACPCPCFTSLSILYVHVHVACPCPYPCRYLYIEMPECQDFPSSSQPGISQLCLERFSGAVTWKPLSIRHCQGNFRCRNICQRSDNFKNLQKASRKVTNIFLLWWKDAFTSSLMIYVLIPRTNRWNGSC
jgi:hypothetical protein